MARMGVQIGGVIAEIRMMNRMTISFCAAPRFRRAKSGERRPEQPAGRRQTNGIYL